MADAPDNAAYLLSATDLTLKKSKVLKTDSNFSQVTTATETTIFPMGTLAAIQNITTDGFVAFNNTRTIVNPEGAQILNGNGVLVVNNDGTEAGDITINLDPDKTEQNISVHLNGNPVITTSELNFQSTEFANFSVFGNTTTITVQPTVENRSTIYSIYSVTDATAADVLTFSSTTNDSEVTFSLAANLTGAVSGQCMAVNADGDLSWQTPLKGLKSLELAIDTTAQDILQFQVTPNNPILSGDTGSVLLKLKAPDPLAQKYLRWDTATSKFIYADLDANAIDSLGMTIATNSTNVLQQTTPTLTGPGTFELGFTGGTEGQVVAVDQVEEEMIWASALKSVDVTIGANGITTLKNFTDDPITTTGTISLGFESGYFLNTILSYDAETNAVITRPNKDGAASMTSVGVTTSVGSGLSATGSPVTTTGTIGLGFDTTGAAAGNIFMNTGGSMGWGTPSSVNTSMPRVITSGYNTFNQIFGTSPNKRWYRDLTITIGAGYVTNRFFGVAFPQKRGATLPALWDNLVVSIPDTYNGSTIRVFFLAFNPADDQDSTANNGRGFNYVIYYIPA